MKTGTLSIVRTCELRKQDTWSTVIADGLMDRGWVDRGWIDQPQPQPQPQPQTQPQPQPHTYP